MVVNLVHKWEWALRVNKLIGLFSVCHEVEKEILCGWLVGVWIHGSLAEEIIETKGETMKKILLITALVTIGGGVHSQTLTLSDSFATGGLATNDLNYNLIARQAGTAAPSSISASTNIYASSLSVTGKLNVKGDAGASDFLSTDSFGSEIGADSFRVRWTTQHDAGATAWSMMSVLSTINGDWNSSPMTVNLFQSGYVHLDYGTSTNLVGGSYNLRVDLWPATVSAAIGASYDPTATHEFEIKTRAKTSVRGTWDFFIDGNIVSAGLPYTFEDGEKKMSWWSTAGSDSNWDDLDISTIPVASEKEYLFIDSFDGAYAADANWLYGNRQTNGLVVSSYANFPSSYSITNNKLHVHTYWNPMNVASDFGSNLAGKDFEFSFKVSVLDDGLTWTALYLYDETATPPNDGRTDSRFGLQLPGSADFWACVLYYGTGAAQEIQYVDKNVLGTLLGSTYNLTDEHTYQLISTAGTGGTNTFDLVIDGVTIKPSDLGATLPGDAFPYYFDGGERHIGMISLAPTDLSKGTFFDDLYLKVSKVLTFEEWTIENGLTGTNALRSADVEPDGMNNLLEYALGGDPNYADAATVLPSSEFSVGMWDYVYSRRVDAAIRGLTYDLQSKSNLISSWVSTAGNNESGYGVINPEFEAVTNSFDTTGTPKLFLNLEITEN